MHRSSLSVLSLTVLLLITAPRIVQSQHPTLRQDYLETLYLVGQNKYDAAIDSLKVIIARDSSFFPAYLKIVEVAKYQGALDQCERYFKEALTTSPNNPFLHHSLGLIYQEKKQWGLAYQHILKALQLDFNYYPAYQDFVHVNRTSQEAAAMIKKLLATKPDVAAANLGLAYIYSIEFDRKKQIEFAGKALQLQPNLLNAQYYLAEGYYWSGDLERAKKACSTGLELARKRQEIENEIEFLNLSSFILNKLDDPTDTINQLKTALDLAQKIGNKRKLSDTLNSMTRVHWYLDDFRQAARYAQQALEIDQQLGNETGAASNLGFIGIMNFNIGNYSKGLDSYYRAKDIYEKLNDKSGVAICTGNIASGHLKLGEYDKAIAFADRAINSFKELGPAWQKPLANYLRVKGMALKKLGQYQKALTYYEQSLQILQQLKTEEHQISSTLTSMGDIYRENGDYDKAFDYYARALKTKPVIWKEKVNEETRLSLANLYFVTHQYEKAKNAFSDVRSYGLKIGDPELLWQADAGLASIYKALDNPEKAFEYFTEAIGHIESIRRNFRTAEEQSGFLSDKFDVYSGLVGVLCSLHQHAPGKGYDQQAFSVAERGKAEILLNFLNQGRILEQLEDIAPEFKQKYFINQQVLEKKHKELSKELSKRDGERDESLILSLRNDLDSLQREGVRIWGNMREAYPEFYRLMNPHLVSVEELQRDILAENDLLVDYLVGMNRTYLWAVTRDKFLFQSIDLPRKELKEKLAGISPLFHETKSPADVSIDHRWANIKSERLHDLYKKLVARPLKDVLRPGMRLIISPDDVLHYFPFDILVTTSREGSVRYLIEDHPILYTSSASLLRREKNERKRAVKNLLAFGDPSFQNEQNQGIADWVHAMIPFKSILRMEQFVSLPFSELEVKAIAKDFPEATIFLHADATEEMFKKKSPDYQYIHLATHNIADDQQPMYSKIVFAQQEHGEEDGFLQTYEVFNLNLHADLVALSGCSTGLGRLRRGEGLMGMSRAFLYAGAENLLVSLWPVNDESTAELMEVFYANLTSGMSMARALQKAKIKLIRSENWRRNPFYWGAFVLIGHD